MKVKIVKAAGGEDIWYHSQIGKEMDVVNIEGAYFVVPIPFEYYKNFPPFLYLLKTDCEVIE